jgi:transcription elongation GreA/GreB family factor
MLLRPGHDYVTFTAPDDIVTGHNDELRVPFLRGFAQVCGLASSGTNLWGGYEQIWLRPDTDNKPLFYQLIEMLEDMGIEVYSNDRDERDISIKINCEDWESIGFGIAWIDKIVREGAKLNRQSGQRTGTRRRATKEEAKLFYEDAPSDPVVPGAVQVGSIVTAVQGNESIQYLIGEGEIDGDVVVVSARSPIAVALLGRQAGDKADVDAPGGSFQIEIVDVVDPAF